MSLLGILALVAGATALVLTKFNPTGIETVPNLPMKLPLAAGVAIAAVALALIAFLAAASSPRTGTGIPLLAIVICGGAVLLSWKPNPLTRRVAPAPVKPAPSATTEPAVTTAPPTEDPSESHVSKLFDMNSSSSSTPSGRKQIEASESSNSPATPSTGAPAPEATRPDAATAIRSARAKFQTARAGVMQALESSPAYRAATADADDAEAELKKARLAYEPGSPELIAASQAALQAHAKVQRVISDALAQDPAAQEAAREMQAVQGKR